jgi:hypothetical protein
MISSVPDCQAALPRRYLHRHFSRNAAPIVAMLATVIATALAPFGWSPAARAQQALAPASVAQSKAGSSTAFLHVSVVPMDRERVLSDYTVVVTNGRIRAMGPSSAVRVPPEALTIDARGKFLIPGLADMHVHLGYPAPGGDSTLAKTLYLYIANGITTVRDMHSGRDPDAPQRGMALRRQVESGALIGPQIYTAGDPDPTSPEAAARTTVGLKAAGYDFVKIADMHGAVVDSIAAAAHRVGLRIVGHAPDLPDSGFQRVVHIPYASVEHLTGYLPAALGLSGRWDENGILGPILSGELDTASWLRPDYHPDPQRLKDMAQATQRARIWNCPTLVSFDGTLHRALYGPGHSPPPVDEATLTPLERRYHRAFAAMLRTYFDIIRALHDAHDGLLAGTDQVYMFDSWQPPAGFALQRELELFIEAGLTPYEALETATRNVAVFMGTETTSGTIAVGKRADLVLLGANPLENIDATAALAGTMVNGRWFSRQAIDAQLDAWKTIGHASDQSTNPPLPPYDLTAVRHTFWRSPDGTPRRN